MNSESVPSHRDWKRSFFTIWTGQAFSLLGSSLAGFALVWWLTIFTGSATVLAVGTLMQVLPQIFLGPLMGALVDRWNRRLVMIIADAAIALFSLGLALTFVFGLAQYWQVYVILFVRAVGGVFHLLAMQASTPLMVPEKHLGRVAGANQALQGAMNIVSPALGAVLLGVMPVQGILILDVATALLAILPLAFIPIPQPRHSIQAAPDKTASLGNEIKEGLRLVWRWSGLRNLVLMATLANLFGIPAMAFIPLLVTRHFGLGVMQVGWMGTMEGLGVLAGGVLLAVWGGFRRRIVTILLGVFFQGVGVLLMGLAPANFFWLALAGNLLWALVRPVLDGTVFAMIQSIVPAELQGRVFSIILSGAGAASLIGLAAAGPIVDRTGVPVWFLLTGSISLCICIGGLFIPSVMHIDDRDQPQMALPPAVQVPQ